MKTRQPISFGMFFMLLALWGTLSFSSPGFAQSTVITDGVVLRNANLRAGPGTTFAIAGAARPGQAVTIVA